jgi:UDP-N-acetylglucosamine--N-acetylmuramyl-(pentapeptide) pyrophosphoryl-undecaprenol N-acetylglucosamine transferase
VTSLFVANTGGHLIELLALSTRLPVDSEDGVWVTFDGVQSRSLLAGRDVVHVRYAPSRDLAASAANFVSAARLLRRRRFEFAFSTGAAVAVSFLPLAAATGTSCHYIESAARLEGPSMSGRLLRAVPGVSLYTQNRSWAHGPWRYAGSIFDGFSPADAPERPLRRVVVTLGSLEKYGFRRLVDRLLTILPVGTEVLWQTGSTAVADLAIEARPRIAPLELEEAIAGADVVVAHAGVGTALTAMRAGKLPILVPREAAHGEHVDDHQLQIAGDLSGRGLAIMRRVEDLAPADLRLAASRRVDTVDHPALLDVPLGSRR